ncbi:MAG: homoserine dehydrogenase [Bacilli bacterium]|nr:homoserine dehydrogenase [Bacilli bacterium]
MAHRIAILGYGTIGRGVFEIARTKKEFDVAYVFDRKERFDKRYESLFTDDLGTILNDPSVEIVVEVLGGFDFAYSCIRKCLESRKSVVTANKEVVAVKIDELTRLALDNGVRFLFEASVGGGIPIIKPLMEIVKTSEIRGIYGILNGTTNFILTKVFEGMPFNEALKTAQKLGFAEANPSADLEGLDMVRKIAILADLSWDTYVPIEKVSHIAMNTVTQESIDYAKKSGLTVKFICQAVKEGNEIRLGVAPYYLKQTHPFAGVSNEFNAILLKTYPNDDLTFIGKGAGSLPTASAVVGDLYCIINNMAFDSYHNANRFDIRGLELSPSIESLEE